MLGLVEDDLRAAMGIDVTGVFPRSSKFGIPAADWKEWNFRGLPLLVPGNFQTRTEPNGDILVYPAGRHRGASQRTHAGGQRLLRRDCPAAGNRRRETRPGGQPGRVRPRLRSRPRSSRAVRARGVRLRLRRGGRLRRNQLRRHRHRARALAEISRRGFATSPNGTFPRAPAAATSIASSNANAKSRSPTWNAFMRASATRWTSCTSAAPISARRPRRSAPWRPSASCGSPITSASTTGCTPTPTWKCFKHSCGSVERFFESFIEAGFDIINPVQCSAAGMDPAELKRKYGSRLVFWGGGVDTQNTLAVRHAARGPRTGAAALRDFCAGRRVRLQRHSQSAGRHPGGEHRRHAECRARVQRGAPCLTWKNCARR